MVEINVGVMALIVREASVADAEVICEFILALSEHQNTRQYVLTDVSTIEEQGFGIDRKFGSLLAEVDRSAVGYLTYVWNYSTWAGTHYMHVENVFVVEQHRRAGVGVALMQEAERVCKKTGHLHMKWEVESDNENAIAFYKKLGAKIAYRGVGSCKVK